MQEFESLILLFIYFYIIAGWSSSVARRAHNPKVVGSNPAPAIVELDLVFDNKNRITKSTIWFGSSVG